MSGLSAEIVSNAKLQSHMLNKSLICYFLDRANSNGMPLSTLCNNLEQAIATGTYISLPTASAMDLRSFMRRAKSEGVSDWRPSTRASLGLGWASMSRPSAPAAVMALARPLVLDRQNKTMKKHEISRIKHIDFENNAEYNCTQTIS